MEEQARGIFKPSFSIYLCVYLCTLQGRSICFCCHVRRQFNGPHTICEAIGVRFICHYEHKRKLHGPGHYISLRPICRFYSRFAWILKFALLSRSHLGETQVCFWLTLTRVGEENTRINQYRVAWATNSAWGVVTVDVDTWSFFEGCVMERGEIGENGKASAIFEGRNEKIELSPGVTLSLFSLSCSCSVSFPGAHLAAS